MEMLIYALTNPIFDKTPIEYQRWLDNKAEKLSKHGQLQLAQLIIRTDTTSQEFEEAYKIMQKWGINRRDAAQHYINHINGPCNWCIDVYTDLLANRAINLMEDEGISSTSASQQEIQGFGHRTHLEYLGSPEIEKLTQIKLGDFFFQRN